MPVCFFENATATHALVFAALASSLVFDFIARQSVGGTHLTYFILRQLPVPLPENLPEPDLAWLTSYASQLVGTDVVMKESLGYESPTLGQWDQERRLQLRASLDAYFFSLFGLGEVEVEYVIGTFEGMNRNELATWGAHRTRLLILEAMRVKPWDSRESSSGDGR